MSLLVFSIETKEVTKPVGNKKSIKDEKEVGVHNANDRW